MHFTGEEWASFFLVANVPGFLDTGVVIAAARCGATGILNLEDLTDANAAFDALARVCRHARAPFSVKLDVDSPLLSQLVAGLPADVHLVVLSSTDSSLARQDAITLLHATERRVLVEVTSVEQARAALGADGLIAKGHESGGRIGEETSFVLLQRILAECDLPVWAHGGIGPHSAAACAAGGAAGVVLDSQLLLTPESSLPSYVRTAVEGMASDETISLGRELGLQFRFRKRAGMESVVELQQIEASLVLLPLENARAQWKDAARNRTGWGDPRTSAWPLGQEAAFAASLARKYYNVAGIVGGIRESVRQHVAWAKQTLPLNPGSTFAESSGTKYPVLQGPMTRVSDTAGFAAEVAKNGGLPFLALALMRAPQVKSLLEETRQSVGDRPWGVGILGFVPLELRLEQLAVVREIRPRFCIIAGGRPDQAKSLDAEGITTFLHVPAPSLLRIFLEDGARRFIFEGRECGGHVGPRTSFVLWEEMVDVLLEAIAGGVRAEDLHVVFAGGIHDARSAAMVSALASPLAKANVRIGILMGSAYLFTEESIAGGAIVEGFQKEALNCSATVLLESGAGHTTRCAPSPFVETFRDLKRTLTAEGRPVGEIRDALEDLNVGRLRIASKGITRTPGSGSAAAEYISVSPEVQLIEGMFMIGQVAAMRNTICTMHRLHEDVTSGSSSFLQKVKTPFEPVNDAAETWADKPCDVAIVGMSCLLPGARDIGAFWSNLLKKADVISEVPEDRFDADLYYDPDRKSKDKICSRWGGFLDKVPFDPMRFGIPPNALASIDPMQLLTLVAVDNALKDASLDRREFPREKTSVVLGLSGGLGELGIRYAVRASLPVYLDDPPAELLKRLPEWTEDSFAGILLNVVAGRVANRFNFGGVNFAVDAACASSLAAAYVAARELGSGSSDVVVVGGVDTVQSPFGFLCFSKSQALSTTGRCSTFDESADGIAISEGLTMMVMKRLSDAERDGDRIYAVIKGVAGSSDGRGKSMTAPRAEGQILAMKRAYRQAHVRPSSVSLIEAHGTGTAAGDATEIESLSSLFLEDGALARTCGIGSVKSLIGHTKAAAGATGLLKTALALYYKVLPPTLHVEKPNAKLQDPRSPFYPNIEPQLWFTPTPSTPRRAGVSSFGFGGTNFHAVLEEYTGDFGDPLDRPAAREWPAELFLWRAASKEAIFASVDALQAFLAHSSRSALADVAAAVAAEADRGEFALAITAKSFEQLDERLNAAKSLLATRDATAAAGVFFGRSTQRPKVAFLFPGQGSQHPGMLRDLTLCFPEFLEKLEQADRILAERFPRRFSSYIFPPPAFSDAATQIQMQAITDTVVAQPALGVVEIALHRALERLGVRPDVTAGHSYGEYVALCAAGVMSDEALFRLSESRGRAIKDSTGDNAGTMAAVSGSGSDVERALNGAEGVWVANLNSPRQTIIGGTADGVKSAVGILTKARRAARPIPVACAFHTPLMQPASDKLAASLAAESFATPATPVYSNTTAAQYPTAPKEIAALLHRHLTTQVRFDDEIESIYRDGVRIFVEIGPKAVLSSLTRQILDGRDVTILNTDAAGLNGVEHLLNVLGQLAVAGIHVAVDQLFRGRVTERLNLRQTPAAVVEAGWLVDGTRVFPRAQPPVLTPPLKPAVPAPPTAVAPVVPVAAYAMSASRTTPTPMAAALDSGAADAVMLQYQRLMTQFLDTQTSVMTAFLNGGMPSAAPSLALAETPVLAPKAAAPVPRPVNVPVDLTTRLLQIVSEKTGYPAEMLSPDAGIEADLGIDSIKRIEILSGVQRGLTAAEQAAVQSNMERLTRARSLRDLCEILGQAISASPAPAAAEPDITDINARLLAVVSEKTGYPTEMLNLDAGIEADLGIDSIKRLEILSAVQRGFTAAGQAAMQEAIDQLTRARTLRELASGVKRAVTAEIPPTPATDPPRTTLVDVPGQLLRIVSEKTGYPTEMLDLDAGMEADLGIDSIKRIEILSALQRISHVSTHAPQQAVMEKLTRARTLRELIQLLSAAVSPAGAPAATSAHASREVARFELTAVDKFRSREQTPQAHAGRVCLITDDETGLAAHLADAWTAAGQRVVLLRHSPDVPVTTETVCNLDLTSAEAVESAVNEIRGKCGPVGAVVHLLSLRAGHASMEGTLSEWRERVRQEVRSLYLLARATESDLRQRGRARGALFTAITGRGGEFGLRPNASLSPLHFAVADYVKTAALEFTDVLCKVVDLDTSDPLPILRRKLQEELDSSDETLQTGFPGDRRLTVVPRLASVQATPASKIDSGWVCLLTGGARGITAQIARTLADKYRPTLILAGASPLNDSAEQPEIEGETDPMRLKAALVAQLRAADPNVKPAAVESALQQVLKNREIRATLESIRNSGAKVEYQAIDVRDGGEFGALIAGIYREHGRLDLVIHGAGIIEDRLIRDKTPDSFDRVVHTKADSAYILARHLRPDSLKCLIFMSSITAAFGNRGQADYAAANGAMNGLATVLSAQWPCRVVAMNWGPWDQAGMVSDEVRKQFLALGVQLIGSDQGVEAVLREIDSHDCACPLIALGDGPWASAAIPSAVVATSGGRT